MAGRCEASPQGSRPPVGSLTGERTALVFCRCGPNLGEVVRTGELAGEAWAGADLVAELAVPCSTEGQAWIAARVREDGVRRLVVAGCSPRDHERTFRRALAGAGGDAWQVQMVNLREQAEWLGGDAEAATARARALVEGALARIALHRAIPGRSVQVSGDAVVVGGGAAGIAAALALARRGRKVLLVERAHALGGVAATLDEVFPGMECASCFLQPALDQVLHHPAIEVLTGAEVLDVRGSHGNLTVRVRVRPRRVDPARCLGCDACAAACPVELPTRDGLGLRRAVGLPLPGGLPAVSAVDDACLHVRGDGCSACAEACASGAIRLDEQPLERSFRCGAVVLAVGAEPPPPPSVPGVVSAYQLERMMHPGGPTRGELRRADGRMPRSILLAPAASASDDLWPHELAKLGLRIRHRHPEASVAVAGALEASPHLASLAGRLAASGATVIPGTVDATAAERCGDGVRVRLSTGASWEADLVAVWEPPRPAEGVAELARRLRIAVRPDGFLEDHVSPFEPATSRIAGIHVAGAAGGPRTILQAARDGTAAAGQVLSALEPGAPLELEPLAAEVDVERCAACGICGTVCPFGAVGVSAELGVSRVEPSFCRGCGSCVASCPSGALAAPHFTSSQIAAEVSGLLRAGAPPEERKSGT